MLHCYLKKRGISDAALPITPTADMFQKLSKAYSILTDPAAKVVDPAAKVVITLSLLCGDLTVGAACSGCV